LPSTRTKIIASLGPSSANLDTIRKMVELGVAGFRINFAHGEQSLWREWVELVREAEQTVGRPVAVIGDLVGPSVRVGRLEKPVEIRKGEKLVFRLAESSRGGEERVVPVPVPQFFNVLEEGDVIVTDDGRVEFRVIEVAGSTATVEAATPAVIKPGKALVIRGKDPGLPALSHRDVENAKFALDAGFDYIALSHVRGGEDVEALRLLIQREGGDAGVIAKIENRSAVEHLDDIIASSDAVVVARGDLGMVYGLESVPYLQERIVATARAHGKPVIVATQLLESMIENPAPTRAEVTDVVVAVRQGVDGLMLTGETAIGRFPVEVVRWLKRIVSRAEQEYGVEKVRPRGVRWSYAFSIVEMAERLASILIVYSMAGSLPPLLAASRPRVPTLVGVPNMRMARRLAIHWGLDVRVVEAGSYVEGVGRLEELACAEGLVSEGSTAVEAYRESEYKHVVIIKRLIEC
jgi:pyruvate kinase